MTAAWMRLDILISAHSLQANLGVSGADDRGKNGARASTIYSNRIKASLRRDDGKRKMKENGY